MILAKTRPFHNAGAPPADHRDVHATKDRFDLAWAREAAGLTQTEAAAILGVSRCTFNKWETGKRTVPSRKAKAFLKLLEITPEKIPRQLEYDALGYPVGFDRAPFTHRFLLKLGDKIVTSEEEDIDAMEDALREIEGADHEIRARERVRAFYEGFAQQCNMPTGWIDVVMAEYDEETQRLRSYASAQTQRAESRAESRAGAI